MGRCQTMLNHCTRSQSLWHFWGWLQATSFCVWPTSPLNLSKSWTRKPIGVKFSIWTISQIIRGVDIFRCIQNHPPMNAWWFNVIYTSTRSSRRFVAFLAHQIMQRHSRSHTWADAGLLECPWGMNRCFWKREFCNIPWVDFRENLLEILGFFHVPMKSGGFRSNFSKPIHWKIAT